jgi:hypothetical protein
MKASEPQSKSSRKLDAAQFYASADKYHATGQQTFDAMTNR